MSEANTPQEPTAPQGDTVQDPVAPQNSSILTGTEDPSTDKSAGDPAAEPADKDNAADPADPKNDDADKAKDNAGEDDPDDVVPEAYSDFTLPEGVEMDEAALAAAQETFKELELTQGKSQQLVDLYAKMVQEGTRRQEESFFQLVNDWQTESKNDKEFGGEKFEENIATARLAIEKLGTPELNQLMEDHGVGNHPEMIRFMWKVGNLMREDQPGSSGQQTPQPKDRVSILYPNG